MKSSITLNKNTEKELSIYKLKKGVFLLEIFRGTDKWEQLHLLEQQGKELLTFLKKQIKEDSNENFV